MTSDMFVIAMFLVLCTNWLGMLHVNCSKCRWYSSKNK